MKKINVAMCDDMEELCIYYASQISNQSDMNFIGYANCFDECINLINDKHPDILLLDIQIDTLNTGIELIPEILKISPTTQIIMLTVHENDEMIFNAISDGAKDYLLKTYPDDLVFTTIRSVYNGEHKLNKTITDKVINYCNKYKKQQLSLLFVVNNFISLSASELEILRELYNGKSYREIAALRFTEEITIRTHVSRILKKMEYPNMRTLISELKSMHIFELLDSPKK